MLSKEVPAVVYKSAVTKNQETSNDLSVGTAYLNIRDSVKSYAELRRGIEGLNVISEKTVKNLLRDSDSDLKKLRLVSYTRGGMTASLAVCAAVVITSGLSGIFRISELAYGAIFIYGSGAISAIFSTDRIRNKIANRIISRVKNTVANYFGLDEDEMEWL